MASFVRESKFRHINVQVDKKEKFYEQLRISNSGFDGNGVDCNSQYLAYLESSGSGSAVAVLPLSSVGKNHVPISAPTYQQPIIRAHSQSVQDISFNPFNNHQLLSCSTDQTIKLWEIPNGGYIVDAVGPVATFQSTSRAPFRGLAPHLSAQGILAARGSRDCFLFDINNPGVEFWSSPSGTFASDLLSMSWSFLGDLLLTTSKDKKLRFFDPRTSSSSSATVTADAHAGIRFSRSVWLGNSPYLLTVGQGSMQDRESMLWDSRAMNTPIKKERIDSSTGPLMPYFDADTGMLALTGKGDSSVRLYELDHTSGTLHALSNNPLGSEVCRGFAFLPKQANDILGCEVLRMLKMTDSTIQPVSLSVPRKDKRAFASDLFPPTYREGGPAMPSEAWRSGANSLPSQFDLSSLPSLRGVSASVGPIIEDEPTPASLSSSSSSSSSSSLDSPSTPTSPSSPNPSRVASMNFGSTLKYRHLAGAEAPRNSTFYNLTPIIPISDSPMIASSDAYWAIPYTGGGGPVYVSPLNAYGKVEPNCHVVNGHKASVLDLAFSPFHSNLLATASQDCTVKVWSLPSRLTRSLEEGDAIASLTHGNSVRTVNFHPTIQSLLVSSSLDSTVKFFDIQRNQECASFSLELMEGSQVANVSFNYDGSLLSLACKDRVLRILDPRTGSIVLSTPPTDPASGRNLRAQWCCRSPGGATRGEGTLLSVSSASSGMRQVSLWDPRSLSRSLQNKSIDNASGQLYPLYDEDAGLCFVAGKGDTIIRFYELNFLDESSGMTTIEKSNDFQSGRDPIAGICMLPKSLSDVRNVEVSRLLKFTTDCVYPINFTLPRAENLKQYFQDDIFPPTRSRDPHSAASVNDWQRALSSPSQPFPQPQLVSLRPADMMNLSEKPSDSNPNAKSKISQFKAEINRKEEEDKKREETFSRLQNLAIQHAKYNPNQSGGPRAAKCDAKPIHTDEDDDDGWDD